jgi:hypothetical protein
MLFRETARTHSYKPRLTFHGVSQSEMLLQKGVDVVRQNLANLMPGKVLQQDVVAENRKNVFAEFGLEFAQPRQMSTQHGRLLELR